MTKLMEKPAKRLVEAINNDDPIVKYPNPVLRQVCDKVKVVPEDMPEFVARMHEIMVEANGVGLAAPQLGILKRVFIYDVGEGFRAIVNPVIVRSKGEQMDPEEGCLSIPGLRGVVKRAEEVIVKGLDEHGRPLRIHADGYTARVIQHETDHLDGILFTDRADPATLHMLTPEEIEKERSEDGDQGLEE